MVESQYISSWATLFERALPLCDGNVDEAIECAGMALEAMLSDEPAPALSIDAFFAHDIHNRKAQGILNRSLKAAKKLSAAARKDLESALKRGASGSGEAVVAFIEKYKLQIAKLLTSTQLASVLEGAREVSGDVPTLAIFSGAVPIPPSLEPKEAISLVNRLAKMDATEQAKAIYDLPVNQQSYARQAVAVKEAGSPITPAFAPKAPPAESPEGVHFPTIDEAVRHLSEKNVMTRQSFDALDAAARAKAFTVAKVDADDTLEKIRSALAENVKKGADFETFRKEVMGAVDQGTFLSDAHMETVFRTNVQSAFSDGQMTVLQNPLVRSGFPYSAYDAIHDDRVRHNHLALEKLGIGGTNIYRNDDPVFQTFRPPWDYNDRCGWTPLTVRQASEAGVEEAQKWLETGVEPSDKAFVPMPDFSPPAGFQRALASAPFSIRLSLQSLATFSTDATGHEHKGSGAGGGQFTGSGGGGGDKAAATKTPKKNSGRFKALLAMRHLVPGPVRRKVGAFVQKTYAKLESKYGKAGAIACLTGMVLLSPTPIPGSSLIPIALAEGVKRLRRQFAKQPTVAVAMSLVEALDPKTLAAAITAALADLYADSGEEPPEIDADHLAEVAESLVKHFPQNQGAAALSIGADEYPRDKANRFVSKASLCEAARSTDKAAKLRESLPDDQRWRLDRAIAWLQSGGAINHPKEPQGLATNIDGDIVDKAWADYASGAAMYDEWMCRDTERSERTQKVDAFVEDACDPKAAVRLDKAVASAHEKRATPKDAKRLIEEAIGEYTAHVDAVGALLKLSGATDAQVRSVDRLRRKLDVKIAKRVAVYAAQLKRVGSPPSELEQNRLSDRFEALTEELQDSDAELVLLYEDIAEELYERIEAEAERDPAPPEPEEPQVALSTDTTGHQHKGKGAGGGHTDDDERLDLIANILVAMFGDGAEEVAQSLSGSGDESISAAMAQGNPKVRRRYGKRPGPGWTSGGVSAKGTPIWNWGAAPGQAAAQPVPQAAAPQSPPVAAPQAPAQAQAAPTPVGNQTQAAARTQAAVVAANAAITKLNAGQALTQAEKTSLSKQLSVMRTGTLKSLYTALGGRSTLPNAKALALSVKTILGLPGALTPQSQPPAPAPTPAPPAMAATPQASITPASAVDIRTAVSNIRHNVPVTDEQRENALAGLKGLSSFEINNAMHLAGKHGFFGSALSKKIAELEEHILQGFTGQITASNGVVYQYKNGVRVAGSQKTPPPTPATTAPPPAAANSTHSTIPFKDETSWETGKPENGVVLNGIPFEAAPPKFWEKTKDVDVNEPKPLKKVDRVGVMIQEPDGRIWIVQPTNGFGGRKYTMPGGGVEKGLTDQQNALKEVWEETGLQVEITGFAGDFEDSNNGNNGRLYIGKRIGGAPWDAKIESFIKSQKTGQPAAESETVMLVTPEKAAGLLHRTDDLAQLATVNPIPVNTSTSGNMMKKLVNSLKPKAEAYKAKHRAGDGYLHAIQELRGFNGKPKVVSKKDFDALMAQGGHTEMHRGINGVAGKTATQLADQFRDGDHFPGYGCFGNGTYADSSKHGSGSGNAAAGYAGSSGAIVRIALPKTAKVIKQSELEKKCPAPPGGYTTSGGHSSQDQWLGLQAALAGYDAIEVDGASSRHYSYGKGFFVILNRGICVVQKEDARGQKIK